VIANLHECKKDFCEIEVKVKKEKYFFKNSYRLSGYIKKEFLWGVK
jgi:SH3-like domain-containing protein